jgi:hypothetical protein
MTTTYETTLEVAVILLSAQVQRALDKDVPLPRALVRVRERFSEDGLGGELLDLLSPEYDASSPEDYAEAVDVLETVLFERVAQRVAE